MSGTPGRPAPSDPSSEGGGGGGDNERKRLLEQKRAFFAAVIRDLAPVGFVETRSAAHIALLLWRLRRISRIDAGYLLLESSRKRRELITTILQKAKSQKSPRIDEDLARELRQFIKQQGLSIGFDAKGNPKPQAGLPHEYQMLQSILEHEKDWLKSLEFELKQSGFAKKTRLEIEAIDADHEARVQLREKLEKLHEAENPATPSPSAPSSARPSPGMIPPEARKAPRSAYRFHSHRRRSAQGHANLVQGRLLRFWRGRIGSLRKRHVG